MFAKLRKFLPIPAVLGACVAALVGLSVGEEEILSFLDALAHSAGWFLIGVGGLFALHEVRQIVVDGHLSADAAAGASFSVAAGVLLLNV